MGIRQGRRVRSARTISRRSFFASFPSSRLLSGKAVEALGAAGVRMTGSGSAIFAVFHSRAERDRAEAVLKGNRVFGRYLVMPAALVNRRSLSTALAAAVAPALFGLTKAYGRCKAGTQNEV